ILGRPSFKAEGDPLAAASVIRRNFREEVRVRSGFGPGGRKRTADVPSPAEGTRGFSCHRPQAADPRGRPLQGSWDSDGGGGGSEHRRRVGPRRPSCWQRAVGSPAGRQRGFPGEQTYSEPVIVYSPSVTLFPQGFLGKELSPAPGCQTEACGGYFLLRPASEVMSSALSVGDPGEFTGIFVCVLDGHLPISFLPASVCLKFNCLGKDFPGFFGFILTHFQML
ncbi:hypothetical protein MC885_003825, partial [Smutsia gigantea]